MRIINIETPLSDNIIRNLRAGDKVLISGAIYTARDKAHSLLNKILAAYVGEERRAARYDMPTNKDLVIDREALPFDPKNAIIYYTGPIFDEKTKRVLSAGPTTSSRMDRYTPHLLEAGVKGLIGKGPRSAEVIESIKQNGAVYFCAVGGAGAYLAERIVAYRMIAFEDLGLEAVYELQVNSFPCYVAIDSSGNSVFTYKTN